MCSEEQRIIERTAFQSFIKHHINNASMKKLSNVFVVAMGVFFAGMCGVWTHIAQAQTAIVKGRIFDKQTLEPVIGASVLLLPREEVRMNEYVYAFQDARATLSTLSGDAAQPQQRTGAIARNDGAFEVKNVRPGAYTLIVRSIGYKKYTSDILLTENQSLALELQLTPDVQGTEAVVVTGVASQREKGVAETAIGRIDAASITQNIKFTDATQLMLGKVAGVFLQPSNGTVGAGVRFNIRSNAGLFGGQPTIFIDGIRTLSVDYYKLPLTVDEISPLVNLNPDDIETIEVLKGPSSACLYGTAAQNGIVLISTKRGRPRDATPSNLNINYQYLRGWQEQSRLYTEDMALTYQSVNRIFQQGPIEQHSLNVSGASGIFNYYAAFDARTENGILPKNQMQRLSARANVDILPSKYFIASISTNLVANNTQIPLPNEQNGLFFGWLRNTLAGNPLSGKRFFYSDSAAIAAIDNGIAMNSFLGSAAVTYLPPDLPGVRLRGVAGTEIVSSRAATFYPPGYEYALGAVSDGFKSVRNFSARRMNIDLNASYTHEWDNGFSANIVLGTQLFDNYFTYDAHSGSGFKTQLVPAIQTSTNQGGLSELVQQFREAGIYGRVESSYLQTYFVSFGVRNDFATSLGSDASSIFYPQISGAVRLDKIGVFPNAMNMNLLKLRAGYGESGRLPTLDQSRTFWRLFSGPGSTLTTPATNQLFLNSLGNAGIRPERIREFEVGLDAEFSDRYGLEFTYFTQTSRDAILGSSQPVSIGSSEIPSNIGSIDGWGFESQAYATLINTAETNLKVSAILSYSDNRVLDIGQTKNFAARSFFIDGFLGSSNYIAVGLRRGEFMGRVPLAPRYRADGYYDWTNGPRMDTTLTALGSSLPLYTGSFSVTLRFLRDFTFYALTDVGLGRKLLNLTRQQNTLYGNDKVFNRLANQLGLAPGQLGDAKFENIPRLIDVKPLAPNTPEYRAAAEAFMRLDPSNGTVANFLESADWVRLRELSLRWNARNLLASEVPLLSFVRELSVGIAVRNAFIWTNYSGIDVEYNSPGAIPSQTYAQASDNWVLMQPRVVQFVLNIGF
jgi:TonB-dependent SusC/RagA subfamily outer membrane receptor